MSTYQDIQVTPGRIARVTLDRPEKRNAMTPRTMAELVRAFRALDRDPGVAVILLSGSGKGFCSGADLGGMTPGGVLDSLAAKRHIMELLTAMGQISKVIVSQVHGFALAGGFGLAVAADLTVVSDDCKLGMPEIRRGLAPMNIMAPLSRCIPRKALLELMFTGALVPPERCVELGLANRVVPAARLEDEALALAEAVAQHSTAALGLCKEAFYQMQDMEGAAALHYLTDRLTLNAMTEDAQEGVAAFLAKRTPVWRDR